MNEFVVYVLFSEHYNRIYIGYTSDLVNRMGSHNYYGKSDYTSKYRPWQVVYVEFFESKSEAIKREKQLKSARGREFIHSELLKTH